MLVFRILAALLAICVLVANSDFATWGARRIVVSDIAPELGFAYLGSLGDEELNDAKEPTGTMLFLVEERSGTVLQKLEPQLGESYLYRWLVTLLDLNYQNQRFEVRTELGPAKSLHADIRNIGNGRYSVWGKLYFSLPNNAALKPADRLELVVPAYQILGDASFRAAVLSHLNFASVIIAVLLAVGLLAAVIVPGRYREQLTISVVTTGVTLTVCFGFAEIYFRYSDRFPISQNEMSGTFDPEIGMILAPNSKIKFTNGVDFWVEDKTNSLGMADREPSIPKPPGTYRIMIVGPSYLEALQVNTRDKFQSLLSDMLKNAFPDKTIDVVAIGVSATSQSNQIAYLEKFKRLLQPDFVLLLFAQNDFANNSDILGSIRQTWDPRFPPFLFFEKTEAGCRRIPIAADYRNHLILGTEAQRADRIRDMSPVYRKSLEGWNPDLLNMDSVFYQSSFPALVFQEALHSTECALSEWKRYAASDKFQLVVVAADNVTEGIMPGQTGDGQIRRLKAIADDLQIPLIDLYPAFAKYGPANARWKHDGHWNLLGHKLAAKGLFDYIRSRGLP